jgi:hypothetical protein
MQNRKLSIRKIVSYLNDSESEGGGFWLPNSPGQVQLMLRTAQGDHL